MVLAIRALSPTFAKVISAATLGGAIFWRVATHCDPQTGEACEHVLAADVNARIGNLTRYVETPFEPALVFELKPGRHTIRMSRHGQTLSQEEFHILRGGSIILMPIDRPAHGRTYALNKTGRSPNKIMEGMPRLETVDSQTTRSSHSNGRTVVRNLPD